MSLSRDLGRNVGKEPISGQVCSTKRNIRLGIDRSYPSGTGPNLDQGEIASSMVGPHDYLHLGDAIACRHFVHGLRFFDPGRHRVKTGREVFGAHD